MKKFFLCPAVAFLMHMPLFAQGIEVVSNTPIPISEKVYSPVISPTGDYVLVTTDAMKGLQKYDLASGSLTTLTSDNGAGYNPKISQDGNVVVYRESNIKNKLRYITIKSLDLTTGKNETLVKDSRSTTAFTVDGGTAVALVNNKVKTKQISGKKVSTSSVVVAGVDNGNLMLTKNGKTIKLNPKGDTRYLWVSLSPDGRKILFGVPESGIVAYVCDINGKNLSKVGRMSAPAWMGNDWIVGMNETDNGEVITTSTIVAARTDGKGYTALTDGSDICLYPTATVDASKIAYSTADGKVFIMSINVK